MSGEPVVEYAIDSGWLIETTTECTCDGMPYGHERHCGKEPIARVEEILSLNARLAAVEAERHDAVARLANVRALADEYDGVYGQRVAARIRAVLDREPS